MYIHANDIYLRVKTICLMIGRWIMTENKHSDGEDITPRFPRYHS
jgi:hypothetical protein